MSSGKHQSPLSEETPYYVLIECEGSSAEKDAEVFQEVLGNLLENEVIADAALAESVAQREALWAIRDDIETIQHGLPKGLAFDISLPLDHIEQYVDDVKASLAAQDPDYKIATFGHLGDNNVHLGISINPEINDYRTKIMQAVYVPLQKYQGSISAEHGIGLEKKNYLKHSRSEEYINLIRTLKMSLDPHCILNPGKVIDLKS
jgi:FAD/FMN-containing dehydrogenase